MDFMDVHLFSLLDTHMLNVEQNHNRKITGPFSLREKVRMRGINQEACIDIDPLTLGLSP
jgi:hypothetical protein